MSAFDPDSDLSSDVAFRLVAASFVRLFWRHALLDQSIDWLLDHGYQVVRLDASAWTREEDLHTAIAQALEFPNYYGRNLDALNDCLSDVTSFEYGARRDATGLVIVFTGYDKFAAHCPRAAQITLTIIADQARSAALFGHRMCCLVQTDDPDTRFDPVGAMPVLWNDAEWLDSKRHPD
ncbi:barstar family protein [Nonomuraea sediminis]|uniref:barstar family protein n=1 Tax=Nonomuraea sediminis TaxID=2835864 RepID=UPI001BDC564E|nr:barstar family protein [Nonomuraea sediminis]